MIVTPGTVNPPSPMWGRCPDIFESDISIPIIPNDSYSVKSRYLAMFVSVNEQFKSPSPKCCFGETA